MKGLGNVLLTKGKVLKINRRHKIIVNVVVLVRKVFNSDNYSIMLEVKNAQVSFAEKIIIFKITRTSNSIFVQTKL